MRDLLPRQYSAAAWALVASADASRDLRRWPEAAEKYAKALEVYPNWPEICVQYGHALKESGDVSAAEESYRKALYLDPENADTHLQLGHVLKMQGRRNDAIQSYAAALLRNSHLLAAREELVGLGLTTSFINLEVSRLRRAQGSESQPAGQQGQQPTIRGEVTAISSRQIKCLVWGLSRDNLPVQIVARTLRATLATLRIDQVPTADPAEFSIDLPQRLAISDLVQVHVFLDPLGIEIEGSPIAVPGSEASDVLRRLERLELLLSSIKPPPTPQHLAEEAGLLVMGQVAALLQQQQMLFERLILESNLPRTTSNIVQVGGRTVLSGGDPFPGYGWFEAEQGVEGKLHRWMSQRSLLLLPFQIRAPHLLWVTVDDVMSEHLLGQVSVTVVGKPAPLWITRQNTNWRFSILLDAELMVTHELTGIVIDVGDALYAGMSDRRRLTFAVSRVEFFALADVLKFPIRVDRESPHFIEQESTGERTASLVFPGSPLALVAKFECEGLLRTGDLTLTLNGRQLGSLQIVGSTLEVDLPTSVLRSDANVIALASRSECKVTFLNITQAMQ